MIEVSFISLPFASQLLEGEGAKNLNGRNELEAKWVKQLFHFSCNVLMDASNMRLSIFPLLHFIADSLCEAVICHNSL